MSDFNSNDDFNTNSEATKTKFNSTLFVIGMGLVFLGCLLILENITNYPFRTRVITFWPIIIVALGIVKLVEGKFRCVNGWIITALGLLLLAHTAMGRSLLSLIGPAILVIVGIFIVMHALKRHRKVSAKLQKSGDFARGTAIFSSYLYKPNEGLFNGGEITAIFGGFELDLRNTTMKHDSARIDVFTMFGGGEIRVPEDWNVSVNVSAVAGGVENKTVASPVTDSPTPKLLITGSVLLGGVSVKSGAGK
ncbi:MAG: cell wall-active antibiotics response protein [Holophagales bacterium]|jgi:predicted membrane protein|nr:cell wall-active antibiotics response protein [Holophagales bacterium]